MDERIITNGRFYCVVDERNAIRKTTNPDEATRMSESRALSVLKRATRKLKGYGSVSAPKIPTNLPKPSKDAPRAETSEAETKRTKRKSVPQETRVAVYSAAKGRCRLCGEFVPYDRFTIDHVIPLAKGGRNEVGNYAVACEACNRMKQDLLLDEALERMTKILERALKENGVGGKKRRKFAKIARKALSSGRSAT